MVEIDLTYQGDLRCEAVHGPSGTTLATDAPTDNEGRGESFSPTDLLAAGLGSCLLTILGIVARRHEVDVTGATAHVTKAMTTERPRRIARLCVTLTVPCQPEESTRELMERAMLTCPVKHSLHPEIDLPIEFRWGC